ncbi:MAG: O-antigen ligase family protein [Anaerolineales bacterium]|nr:O-antigen ligase family protein [Anaerolineales bacterium]
MAELLSTPRLQRAARLFWGLLLFTIPVTSFRYMPDVLGATLVRPLAFYPLVLLVPVLLLLFLRQRRIALPPNFNLLLAFLLFAMLTTLLGALLAPFPLRDALYGDRTLRAWLSLLIGLAFFFSAFWMTRSQTDFRASLRWLYAGLSLLVVWGLIQAVAQNTSLISRSLVSDIQELFSIRPLVPRRVSGFAYEPSWLGDQISIFYFPWLLASLLNGYSIFKRRWVELVLFVLTWAVLLFSYSRGGMIIGLSCTAVVALLMGRAWLTTAWRWFSRPLRQSSLASIGLRAGLVFILIFSVFFAFNFLSDYEYFASLWDFDRDHALDYVINISAGPRLGYGIAGFQVFSEHPFTGVGFGAAGLYLFPEYPDWVIHTPEVARHISPDSTLIPNIKSLYVRLLAETGLFGFWLFAVFFLSFFAALRRMAISGDKFLRFVATAGLFALFAVAIRNTTQDSLTFPIMWITLGILAGLTPKAAQYLTWKGRDRRAAR